MGYTVVSAADQVRLVAHVSRWLAGRGVGVGELTVWQVEQFLRPDAVLGMPADSRCGR